MRSVISNISSNRNIVLSILAIFLASVACQIDLGGPERPGGWISSDPAIADQVTDSWAQAIIDAVSTGEVIVIFNETQITSYLAQRLQASQSPLLLDPQVYLREGTIQVYGIFTRGMIKAGTLIRLEPSIDAEGKLILGLQEARVGPIPAPDILLESISAVLTEALAGPVGTLATGIRLTSVAVTEGEMSIVGEVR